MPDVLLFGATGYTGRLTADALARRGADFAICGRSAEKLEALGDKTGCSDVRIASAGDADALVQALDGVKVLITCVGPFIQLGDTAVEAAIRARVHYVDSTGESEFIADLIARRSDQAKTVGIAMAPALGFDEAPSDVAATIATEGMHDPELILTYAVPATPSAGTAKSTLHIMTRRARWIEDGAESFVETGRKSRWAPMPAPLGPKRSVSLPLAEGYLAPLHIDLKSLRLYGTVGRAQELALKTVPAMRLLLGIPPVRGGLEFLLERTVRGPEGEARDAPWTILAEAVSKNDRRNVVIQGKDVYGLTAECLATAALHMADEDFNETGVLAPVQAVGLAKLQKELVEQGVSIEVFES
ncbi:MAG: saccharopine dehydrogenase NADP-binding domain-containing protein [Actinomycetota bacterium]|nr:saccharopine dehydrogenase NADP-binding domain-containing protein [Actinomycetota bacterium]